MGEEHCEYMERAGESDTVMFVCVCVLCSCVSVMGKRVNESETITCREWVPTYGLGGGRRVCVSERCVRAVVVMDGSFLPVWSTGVQ